MTKIREEHFRRLIVVRQLLIANAGGLTIDSDPILISQTILSMHDAADHTLAVIADFLNIPEHNKIMYLMDYFSKINNHDQKNRVLEGRDYFSQLNTVRNSFKHQGILPNQRQWYTVVERTKEYIHGWCRLYLDLDLNEMNLMDLVTDETVKNYYKEGNHLYLERKYKNALESLAKALYKALDTYPGLPTSLWYYSNEHAALMLLAFGVHPSHFLSLKNYLPNVKEKDGLLEIQWDTRKTGHPGNWTEKSVNFCLEKVLEIALKIQNITWHPYPVEFYFIYDDMITAKSDGVELWREESNRFSLKPPIINPIRTMKKDEQLRCVVAFPEKDALANALAGVTDKEKISKLTIFSYEIPGHWVYVKEDEVEVSYTPKDAEYVKKYFGHIF